MIFKVAYPEMTTMAQIMTAFKGCHVQQQFYVGQRCIKWYFPHHKIAMECAEFGHENRNDPEEML